MDWHLFATLDNRAAADMLADSFRSNGIPTRVDYGALATGADGVRVFVAAHLAHRARWMMAEAAYTDDELRFLATGELNEDAEDSDDR